jgi:periplasmic protein TonB
VLAFEHLNRQLAFAFAFSLLFHGFLLLIHFVPPDPKKMMDSMQSLQVVLVNSKSAMRPSEADALAQSDLNGGGNTSEDRRAKSPLPAISDDPQFTPEQAIQRESQLRKEARRLMTRAKGNYSVADEQNPTPQSENQNTTGEDLVQKSLEIARLESQISKDYDAFQKQPRRKFIGARTREYRFAQYVEDWRVKLERVGNLNYPEAARQNKIYGSLQLTVSIRADGSVESVEVNRSSGQPILDAAAVRIVKLAAPFPPLPADIRKDTDILSITRTWTFTQSDKLESE